MTQPTKDPDYFTVNEAAEYVGVSAQTLRRWDAAGRLKPVRHPASGYRFYHRADLEPFRLEYRRAEADPSAPVPVFRVLAANIEANERLREPQREAHRAVREHFERAGGPAILQVPVGCGKTGIIATLPFGIAERRVLVIAPNLTIRRNILDALEIASNKCFWTRTRTLSDYSKGPYAAVLDGPAANVHDCTESHFVVTNIQQLASSADRWLPQFPPTFFDMILVDEGHHNVATSWRKVFDRFPGAKVVSLTATPFRSDQRPLAGDVIYRYSFARAMLRGYIKEVHSQNVMPKEIYFTYHDDTRHHTLEEVLELREEAWFRKGVALAPECNRHIAEASVRRMNAMREATGTQHQIIAAACSIDHAKQVRAIYEECGLRAREIYSEMDQDKQDAVLEALRQGRIDAIVQVQMLGEGFDHPRLSVAAVFRPFRSLSPYIQFVGRAMRVLHENERGHPDNQAFVVSHVGLNNDAHWDDFRELDVDDQEIFRRWLNDDEVHDPADDFDGGLPRRFDVGMQVSDEVISHFVMQPFLDPEDDRILDKILEQKIPGTALTVSQITSRESLRDQLRRNLAKLEQKPAPISVSPQARRRATRPRVNERAKAVAARVLKDLGLARAGREIARAVPGQRMRPNYQATLALMNAAINHDLGIDRGKRNQPTATALEKVFDRLDTIGDRVRDSIRKAREG